MKSFDTGIIVGRFQHIHNGHEKIINIGKCLCDKLLILVDSCEANPSLRNPYDYEYRKKLISDIYAEDIKKGNVIAEPLKSIKNEEKLSPAWGRYVLDNATKILGKKPQCIIYGKDKDIFKCFDKETVKNITEVLVDRNIFNVSATKMREYLMENKRNEWEKYSNTVIHKEYENLRKIILEFFK